MTGRSRSQPPRLVLPLPLCLAAALGCLLLAPASARAVGRCDVAPLGAPDGVADVADAGVILRVAVQLLAETAIPAGRADVAPIELIDPTLVRPLGDGAVKVSDALICLRVGVGQIGFPANLRVQIESLTPPRPPIASSATARVRVENDGEVDAPAGTTVSLNHSAPPPAPPDATASVDVPLAPGDSVALDIPFVVSASPGPSEFHIGLDVAFPELSPDDDAAMMPFEINGPPVADAGPDQQVQELAAVTLTGSGTDPNGDPLSFDWIEESGPTVVLTGPDTSAPTFTAPDIAVETTLVFALRVRDPDLLESPAARVNIQLTPINDPPVVTASSSPPDPPEQTQVTLMGTADDPNADPLTLLWVQVTGPPVSLDTPDQLVTTFTLPRMRMPTLFGFELQATDNEAAVGIGSVELTALPVNETPLAVASGPASVLETRPVTLMGDTSSDPDDDPLTFSWSQLSGPSVTLSGADTALPTFTAPETAVVDSLSFELRVEDPSGAFDTATVSVEVDPDPLHPAQVIVRPAPRSAAAGTGPAVAVEVEVLARDAAQRVPDGTQVQLSTSLGSFEAGNPILESTRLGVATAFFVPGTTAGDATLTAAVPNTSAQGQDQVHVGATPDAIGNVRVVLDPAAIPSGSTAPVRVVASVLPADEQVGAVANGTSVVFTASAGTFQGGGTTSTTNGIATVWLDPPATPPAGVGEIQVTATADGVQGVATLGLVADPSARAAASLSSEPGALVAGGAGSQVTARLEPVVRGAVLGPLDVQFDARDGLVDGAASALIASVASPNDADASPFGDFAGVGDTDADGDGILDPPGPRDATVAFTNPGPLSQAILGRALLPDFAAEQPLVVVPLASDPASLRLTPSAHSLVATQPGVSVTAGVNQVDGSPVADGEAVDFASSRGVASPTQVLTSMGTATTTLAHPDPIALPAHVRAQARAGGASESVDLVVVPAAPDPAELQLSLSPALVGPNEAGAVTVQADVWLADGSAAPDGTRVVFETSAGLPSGAFAQTLGGIAQILLDSPVAPGAFEVHGRIAGTLIDDSVFGSTAPRPLVNVVLSLTAGTGIGSMTMRLGFPGGSIPLMTGGTVTVELIPPAEGGVAPPGSTFFFGNVVGGEVLIGLIDFQGIDGPGPLLRVPFELPPGGVADCSVFSPFVDEATDINTNPIAGVGLNCLSVDPRP